MRKLFIFLAVMFGALIGRAATPTLTNFNLQHFVINQVGAPTNVIKLHVNPSEFVVNAQGLTFIGGNSATNALTNLYVQNFLTTNFFAIQTNLFFTNLYVSNIFVTNITIEGGTIINTNTLIENTFVTNITDNSTTIFTNSTVIFTNSTVVINGTNVATLGDLVFTNSAGFIYSLSPHTTMSVTNLTSDSTMTARGAFITTQETAAILAAGNNVVDTTGKALIYLISGDPSAVVQLTSGNGVGAHLWLLNAVTNSEFTLPTGPLADDTNLTAYIRGGVWAPTELGESIELLGVGGGWDEIGRSNPNGPPPAVGVNYWTNDLSGGKSVLRPVDSLNYSYAYVSNFVTRGTLSALAKSELLSLGTNVIESGTRSQFILQSPTNDAAQVILSLDAGTNTIQWLEIYNYTNVVNPGAFTLPANSHVANSSGGFVRLAGNQDWVATNGLAIFLRFVSPDWIEVGRYNFSTNGSPTGPSVNYWTNIAGVIQPIDLTLPVMVTNQIRFWFGSSNYLGFVPSGLGQNNNLGVFSTGGSQNSSIDLVATDGIAAEITGYRNGSFGVLQLIGKSSAQFGIGPQNVSITEGNNALQPNNGGVISLGQLAVPFANAYLSNSVNLIGYSDSFSTNYSRLAISHTGTNGAVVFDSQASGIAGPPRPYNFDFGGTNLFTLSGNAFKEAILTATQAGLELVSGSGWGIGFSPNGNFSWQIDKDGHLLPASTGTFNIGVQADGTLFPPKLSAADTFIIRGQHTPASSSETNYAGAIAYDDNNLYIWTSTNVNKKVTLTSW